MTLHTWLGFFAAAWVISLSPGAGAVASMSSGMRHGWLRAMWNVAGLQAALVIQVAVCGLGLGAALAASELAFAAIKWFGVAYLCWLGIQKWREPVAAIAPELVPDAGGDVRGLFVQGLLVNLSNPKAIVFMLAVLPQFIDPQAPQWPQYAICAATMVTVDMLVMGGYAALAARVLALLRQPRQVRLLNRSFGTLFIGAAALLATVRRGA